MTCPFCDGAKLDMDKAMVYGKYIYWIQCAGCEAEGPTAKSKRDAVKLWDRRK